MRDARRRSANSGSRHRGCAARGVEDCGIEALLALAVGNLARFGQDRLALHRRSREAPGPRGSTSTARSTSRDCIGAQAAMQQQRRDRRPQRSIGAVIGRQRMEPAAVREPTGARDSRASRPRAATIRIATSARPRLMRPPPAYFRPRRVERLERRVACRAAAVGIGAAEAAPGRGARADRPCPTSWHIRRRNRASWAWPACARP